MIRLRLTLFRDTHLPLMFVAPTDISPVVPVPRGRQRFDTRSRGRLSQTSLVLLTQASCYRFSAMEVMHKLINSTAHFVRCVRSNGDGAADSWDMGEKRTPRWGPPSG